MIHSMFSSQSKNRQDDWMRGFEAGYLKAWDTMIPTMLTGIEKTKKQIADHATDQAVKQLEPVVHKRLKEEMRRGSSALRTVWRSDNRNRDSDGPGRKRASDTS